MAKNVTISSAEHRALAAQWAPHRHFVPLGPAARAPTPARTLWDLLYRRICEDDEVALQGAALKVAQWAETEGHTAVAEEAGRFCRGRWTAVRAVRLLDLLHNVAEPREQRPPRAAL